ncbi:hypothetical protein Pst134EA_029181 [Puccinia striiformis f. sp. tritici]|uniref:hypothetical protein n=1 Tax=Puccinia striiformis f. sp. tritici TaxID=168172 RepID=UPI002008CAB2|nr:hypothetical protein Pst134EA_029127 [Puccinia striiformis f. sp. tritici]XP_047798229.1 hypothetical protein Pst134EA_029181 [Puccinia striiformis f. sp. tritici]KAH9441172.1 hypothetical protein Pst134EB_029841 [Puccinia striiformis f. sp. tritici]KAH9447118.1 hypothetical protein Pst134EA_029127 [Puccinia striiformis f. sp. tritici]KAH9447139.1 hypothetical protein Pst134EA_029181 [Puccinia striiformis f. sp. tritici]
MAVLDLVSAITEDSTGPIHPNSSSRTKSIHLNPNVRTTSNAPNQALQLQCWNASASKSDGKETAK